MQVADTTVLYFETGPANRPTLRVRPGETFAVQTQLNRGPWFDAHPDGERLRALLRGGNPASGCIWVEGAEPICAGLISGAALMGIGNALINVMI